MAGAVDDGDVYGVSRRVLEALADATGIDLVMAKGGLISGGCTAKFASPGLGLKGRFKVRIVSNFASPNGEDVGLLLEVSGHLHLFAFASDFDNRIKLMVIDSSKIRDKGLEGVFESQSVRSWNSAMKLLQPGVVASYDRDYAEGHWSKLETA